MILLDKKVDLPYLPVSVTDTGNSTDTSDMLFWFEFTADNFVNGKGFKSHATHKKYGN